MFTSSLSSHSLTVYKGNSVTIPVTISNTDTVDMNCQITSSLGEKNIQVSAGTKQIINFQYSAPNKINSLQPASIEFTTSCTGPPPYSCWFFDTCRYVSTPISDSPTIYYALSPQDQQNLAIMENYRQTISDKITTTDSDLKTLRILMDKTPIFLQTSDVTTTYNNELNIFNSLNLKFNNLISFIEQENYDSAVDYNSPSNDLNTLNDIDFKATSITSEISNNLQKYKDIVSTFNSYISDSTDLLKPYTTKSNSDILDQYSSLTSSIKNKLENYQFDSLQEAQNTVEDYKTSYEKFISELKDRESIALTNGISLLKIELKNICSDNNLCVTKNTFNSESGSNQNLQQICTVYQLTKQEVEQFNQKIFLKYQGVFVSLPNANSLSLKEKENIVKTAVQNINSQILPIETDVSDSVKQYNYAGKSIDVSVYTNLIQKFNNANLNDKKSILNDLSNERDKIVKMKSGMLAQENSFFLFFKKIYYSIFGSKQKIPIIDLGKFTETSKDFDKFYSDICISNEDIKNAQTNAPDVVVSNQQSDIKTIAETPKKSCIDENGQRTTNCCDDDSYKDKQDLYPVIFVHGHASEAGQKTVQNSLGTFASMLSYFGQKNYVIKDTLYPEKTNELSKGLWGYCKPVAVTVTYYEGIMNGGSVDYKSSIGDYAPTLSNQINAVLKATNKNKAIIVAHSMGGVLSRYYIKNNGGQSKIYKLITINSPHYGTRNWISFLSDLGGKPESKEMKPGSSFLNSLNNPSDSLVDTYSIMGDSEYCSGGECDGVLYVDEAKLQNGKDFIIFKGPQYEHSSIVNQLDVAQKVLDIIKK